MGGMVQTTRKKKQEARYNRALRLRLYTWSPIIVAYKAALKKPDILWCIFMAIYIFKAYLGSCKEPG